VELKYVRYEIAGRVAAITLDRPDKANAQNERMLDELEHCFTQAEYDDDVRVIVLRATGKHFSAGHDLAGGDPDAVSLAEADGRFQRWAADLALQREHPMNPDYAANRALCVRGGT